MKTIKSLCTPAYVYLGVSLLGFISLLIQNCDEPRKYKVGAWESITPCHNISFFIFKAIYILIWTFILDKLCKNGYTKISWFLFLLPLIFMFIMIGLFLLVVSGIITNSELSSSNIKEEMSTGTPTSDPVVIAKMAVHGGGGVGAGESSCKNGKKWHTPSSRCINPINPTQGL